MARPLNIRDNWDNILISIGCLRRISFLGVELRGIWTLSSAEDCFPQKLLHKVQVIRGLQRYWPTYFRTKIFKLSFKANMIFVEINSVYRNWHIILGPFFVVWIILANWLWCCLRVKSDEIGHCAFDGCVVVSWSNIYLNHKISIRMMSRVYKFIFDASLFPTFCSHRYEVSGCLLGIYHCICLASIWLIQSFLTTKWRVEKLQKIVINLIQN